MKSRERESEEKTLLDLCAGPSSPVAVPDPRGCMWGRLWVWGSPPVPGWVCARRRRLGTGFLAPRPWGGWLEQGWCGVNRLGSPACCAWEGPCPLGSPAGPAEWGAAARWGWVSCGMARVLDGLELGTPSTPRGAAPGSVPDPRGFGGCSGACLGRRGWARQQRSPWGLLQTG